MIKAIFFDIDGTLKSIEKKEVPESTKRTLKKLKENGIYCFICTGRPPMFLKYLEEELDFPFDGYVLLNGQYCMDGSRNPFYKHPLDVETVKKITVFLRSQKEMHTYYMQENTVYTLYPNEYQDPVWDDNEKETFQISPTMPPELDSWLLEQVPFCRSARWNNRGTDLIPIDGGKHVGMKKLLEHYGIQREECMAFGDGANDIEMLRYAGIGVCMGNGMDVLKQEADYITDSVNEDGIEKACIHFCLI